MFSGLSDADAPNRYIKNLHTYLLSFSKRTQPLVDIDAQQRVAETDFETEWEAGSIAGWEEAKPKTQAANGEGGGIWCAACKWVQRRKLMRLN